MTTYSMAIFRKGNDLVMQGGNNETWTVSPGDSVEIMVTLPEGTGCWLWILAGMYSGDAPSEVFPLRGTVRNQSIYISLQHGLNLLTVPHYAPRPYRQEFSLGLSNPNASGPNGGGGSESKNGTLVVTG